MGSSFFKEKPTVIDIFKGTGIYSSEETSECNILYYVYDGAVQILFNEQIITVFKGQALLIGKNIFFQQFHLNQTGFYQILMAPLITYHQVHEWNNDPKSLYRIFDVEQDEQLYQNICEKLLYENKNTVSSPEIMDSLLESLLSILWKNFTFFSAQQTNFVLAAKFYIEKHFRENLTLTEIANHVNVSVYHLAHTLKEEIGSSPIQYAIHCRMECAKKQLNETNLSIQQIALDLGYDNPNYFNLLFKKMTGKSPGKYRKENKNR